MGFKIFIGIMVAWIGFLLGVLAISCSRENMIIKNRCEHIVDRFEHARCLDTEKVDWTKIK